MVDKKAILFFSLALIFIYLSCSDTKKSADSTNRKRTLLVNLGIYTPGTKLAFGDPIKASKEVAEAYTKIHPETAIKFVQQVVISGSQEGEWLKAQLVGGIAPDVISQNAEVTWPDVAKGWYVPLDEFLEKPNPYIPGNKRWLDSFVNLPLVHAKRALNGKLYCISIDIVETAVYYNKTIFDQLNLKPPETWEEFIHLQQTLLDNGITPMPTAQDLVSDWGQDIIFDMLYNDIIERLDIEPSIDSQEGYMGHYLLPKEIAFLFTKGYFTRRDPRWVEMHRILKDWRKYWAKELKNSDTSRLFLTGRAAMCWDGSWFTRRLLYDPYLDFEWGIFYLPKITKQTSRFASGAAASVIGGAAIQLHVTNSAIIYDHLEDVIDFLMFYTAPQNFEKVINETLMFLPNIHDVAIPEELRPINEIFQRRYCAVKWLESFDPKYKSYWRRMLDLFLNDGLSMDQYLATMEDNFNNFIEEKTKTEQWDFSDYEKVWQKIGLELE